MAKTPKTGTKLKLSTPKTPVTETSGKTKTPKSRAKAAVKAIASDDEVIDTPKIEPAPLTPAAAKEIKEKKGMAIMKLSSIHRLTFPVLFYRHRLQRGFLSRDTMPKEDEMKVIMILAHHNEDKLTVLTGHV